MLVICRASGRAFNSHAISSMRLASMNVWSTIHNKVSELLWKQGVVRHWSDFRGWEANTKYWFLHKPPRSKNDKKSNICCILNKILIKIRSFADSNCFPVSTRRMKSCGLLRCWSEAWIRRAKVQGHKVRSIKAGCWSQSPGAFHFCPSWSLQVEPKQRYYRVAPSSISSQLPIAFLYHCS